MEHRQAGINPDAMPLFSANAELPRRSPHQHILDSAKSKICMSSHDKQKEKDDSLLACMAFYNM